MPENEIRVYRGDGWDLKLVLTIADEDNPKKKLPYYITSTATHEIVLTVKSGTDDPDAAAWITKKYSEGDMTVRAAPDNNVVIVHGTPGDTNHMAPGRFWWDAQVTALVDGQPHTALVDYFTVLPDVTRA